MLTIYFLKRSEESMYLQSTKKKKEKRKKK